MTKNIIKFSTSQMRKGLSLIVWVITCVICCQYSYAQTRLYKRVMIIRNGTKNSVNDDAHFITFTKDGFYVSDQNGYGIGGNLIRHIKDDDGLHCYMGVIDGQHSEVFFSSDYSRINIKVNNQVNVYNREPGVTTTASMRVNNNSGDSQGASYTPVIINSNLGGSNSSGSRQAKEQTCPGCHGTGKDGDEITYRPDYTGKQPDEYCSKCGKWGSPHYHRQKMCRVCNGRGTIR